MEMQLEKVPESVWATALGAGMVGWHSSTTAGVSNSTLGTDELSKGVVFVSDTMSRLLRELKENVLEPIDSNSLI